MQQNLGMGLSQHLVMTAQMQQAVKILQLSSTELCALIETEFMENPALEMDYSDADRVQGRFEPSDSLGDARTLSDYLGDEESASRASHLEQRAELAGEAGLSLEEELLEQARFAFADERDRAVAVFLIGSTDASGYLTVSVEEAARASQTDAKHVERVLAVYQTFEPVGVGARNLAECLRIQARAQGIYEGLVARLIDAHLPALAASQIREIASAEHCSPQAVQQAADIVRRLDPKPGRAYGGRMAERVVPDIVVRRAGGGYAVELTDARVPRLRIAQAYRETEGFDEATRGYIKKRLSAAMWLITSIEQRRMTIRRVVEEILREQRDYLERGASALRPMTMKQVADATGMHESTVSRAVANKYIELPHGTIPLRRLFSSGISAAPKKGKQGSRARRKGKEDRTAEAARAAISAHIEAEDARSPLSDQKLCALLAAQGFTVSRRTVMKYREQLGYAPSSRRRRY